MVSLKKIGGGLVVVALLVLAAVWAYGAWFKPASAAYIDPSDDAMVNVGQRVYHAQCAACHGAQLEGQPNWRVRLANGRLPAPPHDISGHTWHHPDAVLFDIVKNGLVPGVTAPPGYESDMPAYAGILSDEEIRASLAYIKSYWPKQALDVQRKLTLQPQ